MRIGITVNTAWNIFNFRKGLIQELIANGHQIIAIAPPDEYVEDLKKLGCEYQPVQIYRKSANPIFDLKLIHDLYIIYKNEKLDIVLQFTIKPNIYGSFAAALAGIPTINNVTGLGTVFIRDNLKSKIAKQLYRWSFHFPKVVFFQNKDDQNRFLQDIPLPSSKIQLLPGSGINLNHFEPSHKKCKTDSPFVFLLIARLLVDKGILEFIEACKILQKQGINARFQLLGNIENIAGLGIPPSKVKSWEKSGIIEYLGTTKDVRPHIDNADCIVLPSYREGTPRSLLEAASQGKPLIATNVAGCKEVVKHNYNGLLCKVKDGKDLANTMCKVYQLDTKTLKQMGVNSRKLMEEKFDEQIVIRRYKRSIEQVFAYEQPLVLASI